MPGIGIKVAGLTKRLKAATALSCLTASFEPGLLHGVIGSDGAGKTTVLRTMVGLLHPDEGNVEYLEDGHPVPFESIRPRMAYMPQSQSLYPDLSIDEHMEFFRELYRLSPDVYAGRRDRLLRLTRLADFRGRPAGKLSGGMYKKLGLMCALLQEPAAVLLDEPTNGVDPISRREFWELLYTLTGEGCLVIVTTAYMDEAERCDRVHLLDSGRLLATGEPRAVLAQSGVRSFEELFLRSSGDPVAEDSGPPTGLAAGAGKAGGPPTGLAA